MGYFAYFNVVVHKLFFSPSFLYYYLRPSILVWLLFFRSQIVLFTRWTIPIIKIQAIVIELGFYEILKTKTQSILFLIVNNLCFFVVANFDIHIMDLSDIDLWTQI